MTCILDRYILSVARRKIFDTHGRFNAAIASHIEEFDIPHLLEIIRQQDKAIRRIMDKVSDDGILIDSDAEEMLAIATKAHTQVEELSYSGSYSDFDDLEGAFTDGDVFGPE